MPDDPTAKKQKPTDPPDSIPDPEQTNTPAAPPQWAHELKQDFSDLKNDISTRFEALEESLFGEETPTEPTATLTPAPASESPKADPPKAEKPPMSEPSQKPKTQTKGLRSLRRAK